ncbi:hypothetical protein Mgra_00006026 [Meloidogyne graminicola]|uniref:Transmembrane protein n=1 Tax=Meloidogyne graminicola TaxID=189291 RepID=A0A8S9ZM90_9BILA|nr:hypothetical protein Mgra_00006026 [Meloidogyne graminicola]
MKSIIFNNNNNNNNNNGYWKKQAMLVNMLALSIIVLLLMIEQVNTKEVDISSKDETLKAENLAANAELNFDHLPALSKEEREKEESASNILPVLQLIAWVLSIIFWISCCVCIFFIIYIVARGMFSS